MKKLLTLLSPFAPDHSGAVSVFFELGGLIVICDAGGCTGNICGFDEPRWFENKCALFSAALRDMDAILGQDERLAGKVARAMEETGTPFAVLVGTPVPAIIATDFGALKRMVKKRSNGKNCLAVESKGTAFYDAGASRAYLELLKTFAKETREVQKGRIGVWGATPLDFSRNDAGNLISDALFSMGIGERKEDIFCYGMGAGLDAIQNASCCEKNIVTAPDGLEAAEYLSQKYGTPFEVLCPYLPSRLKKELEEWKKSSGKEGRKKVLVIHQQFAANAVRNELEKEGKDWEVKVGTFFKYLPEYGRREDISFAGEDDLFSQLENGSYDLLVADRKFRKFLKRDSKTKFIPFTHFAVSGTLEESI